MTLADAIRAQRAILAALPLIIEPDPRVLSQAEADVRMALASLEMLALRAAHRKARK